MVIKKRIEVRPVYLSYVNFCSQKCDKKYKTHLEFNIFIKQNYDTVAYLWNIEIGIPQLLTASW